MTKQIKFPKATQGKKIHTPDKASEPSADLLAPIFSLKISKDYCLSNCDKDEKSAFADTLHKLSQSTWRDLRQSGRHGQGYEIIDKKSIKGKMPDHITDDVHIIAFRFFGKKPMAGYRDINDRRIFHVVWLDRDCSLYDHG